MTTAPFELLYVCNGDNARGPLAAACTRSLADTADLGVRWEVSSAGTEAVTGGWVRPEALRAASEVGVDLSGHEPSLLDPERCESPDLILAMSWDQVSHIWSSVPQAWDKVFTVKEFVHWAKRAPVRPPILFSDRVEQMRDKIVQSHAIRKRARADHGFWGGIRPQDLNLIEPIGKGEEAWTALAHALQALVSDVMMLLVGPEPNVEVKKTKARRPAGGRAASRTRSKAKARR